LNVFIASFGGLGNVLGTLPLLQAIAARAPEVHLFVPQPQNAFVASTYEHFAPDLKLGFYPSIWRRFSLSDWQDIESFLIERKASTVLNWRNEGQLWDASFYSFMSQKKWEGRVSFYEAWHLGEDTLTGLSWWELAEAVTRNWRPDIMTCHPKPIKRDGRRIDLFPMASTAAKRWSSSGWMDLIGLLLRHTTLEVGIHIPPDDPTFLKALSEAPFGSSERVAIFEPHRNMSELVAILGTSALSVTLDVEFCLELGRVFHLKLGHVIVA
jgi:ADP-heptose:LPS heptosyltransferase